MKRTLNSVADFKQSKIKEQSDMFAELIPEISIKGAYDWSRISDNNYECSSLGDRRFSALFAKLGDGRTIEEAYQLDVKGYRNKTNNWRKGKGNPPLNNITPEALWEAYLALWVTWSEENESLIAELAEVAKTKTLTDCFAWTPISQARALADILNKRML